MLLQDRYDGRDDPFEGDRELTLRRLPVGARVVHARVTVEPLPEDPSAPFSETLGFAGDAEGWGATKMLVVGESSWVEVDFHTRRTLARVKGSGLQGATLQVDLGGGWAGVGPSGALGAPGDKVFELSLDPGTGTAALPGLTVQRFRLTRLAGRSEGTSGASDSLDLTEVTVRSLPSNVRLGLGGLAPFWIHPGELARKLTTPDFGEVLRAFLTEARSRTASTPCRWFSIPTPSPGSG